MEDRATLLQQYELGRLLGQGAFAKVYYARNLQSNQPVAVKMIDKEKILKVGLIAQTKREIRAMGMVRHPNVLQLLEVMASKSKIYFILELAKGGELFHKVAKGRISEGLARKYFHQLINAVDFCHSRGVYHRDLKPENLLLDENDSLKVSDFGLSALAESRWQDGLLHTTCGTPAYVAPEVLSRKGYDGAKADIWSCGVILYVLAAGYLPFFDRNLIEMYRKISKAEYRCPSSFSPEIRDLLYKILDPDPSSRISISRIKRSAWYRKPITDKSANQASGSGSSSIPSASPDAESDISDENLDLIGVQSMNAFDIISFSSGFDLSGLFDESINRREVWFTSRQPLTAVYSKLLELAKQLNFRVGKKDNGIIKLASTREGRKGVLELDAELFKVTPSLLLVEMRKTSGDTMEYQRLIKREIRLGLKDIVWAWQGDPQQSQPPMPPLPCQQS